MLKGRRILITGAGRGIGAAIARVCAREGAILGLNYHSSGESAKRLASELRDGGTELSLCPFDVSSHEQVKAAIEAFHETHGGLEGLVNNAGLIRTGLFAMAEQAAIEEQVRVNIMGPFHCAQASLPLMLRQRQGVIVNIGSVSAQRPNRGQAVYAATKGAVESFSRALAVEYARKNIRVHCVSPGPVETDMLQTTRALGEKEMLGRVPLRRFGEASEVAELVAFLLSERSSFMTGGVHAVDGGYLQG